MLSSKPSATSIPDSRTWRPAAALPASWVYQPDWKLKFFTMRRG